MIGRRVIISLIRQVGSNKRKIQIKYKKQNKQTTTKKTEHANIPIKLNKLKKNFQTVSVNLDQMADLI